MTGRSRQPPTSLRPFEHHAPVVGDGVYLDPSAVVIGAVTLGDDVSVWPMTVIRGDVNHISIGARTNIQDGCVLHVTHDGPFTPGGMPLKIGRSVTVGHGVILHACTVGDQCLIGMGAVVMDGAVVEDRVMVGAGSLVTPGKSLTSGSLYQGRPARRIRELSAEELESLAYSADHYVRIKNRYIET